MTRVLLIGLLPEAVDLTDPALPPGLTADKIAAGIALGIQQMKDRGWEAEHCLTSADQAESVAMVTERLRTTRYDCIVIGGGIRIPPANLTLFEALVNAVHKAAPDAAIAFNTSPDQTGEAAARWV